MNKLKKFLQENYKQKQAFNSKNLVGDEMETVYDEDNIIVDFCDGWNYIEIFGLTDEEFESLLDEESFLGGNLRDFTNDLIGEKDE